MPNSIAEMIKGDFKCEDIAKCLLGLKNIDIETYKLLVKAGPMKSETLGKLLNRERSTAYRSLQNLIKCGLVHREARTIPSGGYYFEYIAIDPSKLKEIIYKNLDEWYNKIKTLIDDIDKEL